MKTAIVYHRVDWDGYTSAAVAKMAFPDAELIGWTYGDNEPEVSEFDQIVLVDLSLSEDWMLANAPKLIWIDHHKNVIESLQSNPILAAVPGIRMDGIGACYLTWAHFFPRECSRRNDIPSHVRLIATADVMDYTNKLAPIQLALDYMLAMDEYGPGWASVAQEDVSKNHVKRAGLLIQFNEDALEELEHGKELEIARNYHEQDLFKKASVVCINDYLGQIVNIDGRPNACIQTHLLDGFSDFFICIGDFLEDKQKFKISVRVPRESSFDASAFCRQYGGNGHIKAAGCLLSEDEIQTLLNQ
jgi:oligoribonuclease NrnB/cAMP/cGMP phosphodiesterase (DHH superfamily)